jgi:hypothetical protein
VKVIAKVDGDQGYYNNRILVEMTLGEFGVVTGRDYRSIHVDMSADPVTLFRMLEKVRDEMKSAERSAGGFRALADLVEQCVEQAKVAINDKAKPAVESQEVQS